MRKKSPLFVLFFSAPFRLWGEFHVPHVHSFRYRFLYGDPPERRYDSAQMIITNDRKIVYSDRIAGFLQLVKALEWQIRPNPRDPSLLQTQDLRALLLDRIKSRSFPLWDVLTREKKSLDSWLASGIDELYVIHAACMGCELTKLLFNIAEIRGRRVGVVLSVHANSYDIRALLRSQKIRAEVLIDSQDGLGLLHADATAQNALFIFARKDFPN